MLDSLTIPHPKPSVSGMMRAVMLALVPGTLIQTWAFGVGVPMAIAFAVACAMALEFAAVRLRGRPPGPPLSDGSIALAAWLLALAVPPSLPLPQLLAGVAAMVLLGKHLYGGLGCNPFNPAMLGYATLLVSFPVTMIDWTPTMHAASSASWDALTRATPLDHLRSLERLPALGAESPVPVPVPVPVAGNAILTSSWIWINGGFLLGGLWLLSRRVITWHIPISMLATLGTLHASLALFGHAPQPPVHLELLSGAAMLGAFFIATDPVTAPGGRRARLLYGSGIGALTFVLREFSAYPEGVAFAVLLMNMTVPLIDRLSVRGERRR